MQYQLIKSKRKTIAISFDRGGNLVVKAPYFVRKYEIEAFLLEKSEWIEETRIRLKNAKEQENEIRLKLESGDVLFFLGEKRILTVIREERKRAKVKSVMDRLLLWVPYEADYEYKKEHLEKWYRKEAAEILNHKACDFAERIGVHFEDIRIKDQKSRWGSCSSKGNLNFNWRIIMAPDAVCDYVVIHELCHLVHMNHSEDFWRLVYIYCPEYKQCKNWLKENGKYLYLF